jgi:hypothetical protein
MLFVCWQKLLNALYAPKEHKSILFEYSQSGMVVRKLFRIAFALFAKPHRIALFSHRIRIALFPPFLVDISRLMHQKVVKSASKMRKICRKSAKCEPDAKMESKFASHYRNNIFSHFFASHYHPCSQYVCRCIFRFGHTRAFYLS